MTCETPGDGEGKKERKKESKVPTGLKFPQGLACAMTCEVSPRGHGTPLWGIFRAIHVWVGAHWPRGVGVHEPP